MDFYAIPVPFLWNFYAIPVAFLCDSYATSVPSLCDYELNRDPHSGNLVSKISNFNQVVFLKFPKIFHFTDSVQSWI